MASRIVRADELNAVLESLQPKLAAADQEELRGIGADETVSESLSKDVFNTYTCQSSVNRGLPHPGDIAESTSLSAIKLPASDYPLWDAIPESVVAEGKLSQLQLEGVLYACTKHQQLLPSGERAGFFLGDGAGVGKGRQIAGIIMDNYARGRRRAIWVSTSSDLHHDAERDLQDLGCWIKVINNCQALDKGTLALGLCKDLQEGVLFLTYTTLIGGLSGKSKSRLQQIIDWVGGESFDGCIVFDECHKAKNFVPGKESQSTKVAGTVLALQQRLPRARVVYCSATGISEVGNMAYMARLGLWGPGSAFSDFEAFLESMKKRGVSFLEMLSMEMKGEGYYVARGLSFKEAEFQELECKLTPTQTRVYNDAVQVWMDVRQALVVAIARLNSQRADVWKPFWAGQQRFFKLLCVSLKVPIVVEEAKRALLAGQAVVIGLQATGEAAADAMALEPGEPCGWVSVTREMLLRFVDLHFPTQYEANPKAPSPIDGQHDEGCVRLKAALLDQIGKLQLPTNFLDELIHQLGGPDAVAECTGRKGRIVADSAGRVMYKLRAKPDSSELDSLNVRETEAFMSGRKLVAIVSDAASTGISLHADRRAANTRRRIHLTIELPWSADKAIQQLGRSHRSNQVIGPIYKLVSTNLGGERRFAAAVARRLQSLGALTRGDRRAASGIDLSESNFDSPLGRKSLKRMYDAVIQEGSVLPNGVKLASILAGSLESDICETFEVSSLVAALQRKDAVHHLHSKLRDCVDMMGVGGAKQARADTVVEDSAAVQRASSDGKDLGDVKRFLNRLLGLPVARQNLLFSYFEATLGAEIRAAKAEGTYFEGVSEVAGSRISLARPAVPIWEDPFTKLATLRTDLTIDRGMSFEAASRRLDHERKVGDKSGFWESLRPMFGHSMYVMALQKPGAARNFAICRPNTGASYFDMEEDELEGRYKAVEAADIEEGWKAIHESALVLCMHGGNCAQGSSCQVGRRLTEVTILSRSVVRIWGVLERVLQRHEHQLSRSDRTMRVVHVTLDGGVNNIIGVRYPQHLLVEVIQMLMAAQQLPPAFGGTQTQLPPGFLGSSAGLNAQQQQPSAAAIGFKPEGLSQGLGLGLGVRIEPPSPVSKQALAKALRKPRTLNDFFKPASAGVRQSVGVTQQAASTAECPAPAPPLKEVPNSVRGCLSGTGSTKGDLAAGSKRSAGKTPGVEGKWEVTDKKQRTVPGIVQKQGLHHVTAASKMQGASVVVKPVGHVTVDLTLTDSIVCPEAILSHGVDAEGDENASSTPTAVDSSPEAVEVAISDAERQAVTRVDSSRLRASAEKEEVIGERAPSLLPQSVPSRTPFSVGGSGKVCSGSADLEGKLESLVALGFSRDQASRALHMTGRNVERAANWLYNTS